MIGDPTYIHSMTTLFGIEIWMEFYENDSED